MSNFVSNADLENGFHPLVEGSLYIVGLLRRLRGDMRANWDGGAAPSNKHVVYVHFDGQGRVHDYVLFQIRCFVNLGYAVTFVTNSPLLRKEEIELLVPLCRKIVWRRNVGYDFGAYRDGLNAIADQELAEQIILTNDSVYGPFFPLEEYLSKCTPDIGDIWGMTDNHLIVYHLQSYFLLLHPAAIMSPKLRRFWRWFPNVNSKKWAILKGELEFSATAASAGLKLRSLFRNSDSQARIQDYRELTEFDPSQDVAAFRDFLARRFESASTLNPMSHFGDILIECERFPYLKRNIFLKGAAGAPRRRPWAELVSRVSHYDTALMTSHIESLEVPQKLPAQADETIE